MTIRNQFGDEWYELLKDCLKSDYFNNLGIFLNERRGSFNVNVYPNKENIFKAFKSTPLDSVRCVIIGYEPYKKDYANGLAFGYNGEGELPKSSRFIFTEYEHTIMRGLDLMYDYSLDSFSKKGILMLNLALTTESNNSHIKHWQEFTKYLLKKLNQIKPDLLYVIMDKRAMVCKGLLPKYISTGSSVLYTDIFLKIEDITNIKFN